MGRPELIPDLIEAAFAGIAATGRPRWHSAAIISSAHPGPAHPQGRAHCPDPFLMPTATHRPMPVRASTTAARSSRSHEWYRRSGLLHPVGMRTRATTATVSTSAMRAGCTAPASKRPVLPSTRASARDPAMSASMSIFWTGSRARYRHTGGWRLHHPSGAGTGSVGWSG